MKFPHEPPTKNHFYEKFCFKRNVDAIFLVYRPGYLFNDHRPHRTIWGFYNTKKQQYLAPINSKKPGKEVKIEDTSPYSAMKLNLNPLERAFL